jgi:serine/threonine protein kinase
MASKKKVSLHDYDLSTTLGTGKYFQTYTTQIGSFGRVRLARNKKTGEYFAMKILKKADIIKLKQVDHVISENTILADIDHPFLVCNLSASALLQFFFTLFRSV